MDQAKRGEGLALCGTLCSATKIRKWRNTKGVWKQLGHDVLVVGHIASGAAYALNGSDGLRLSSDALPWWRDLNMQRWRQQLVV